MKISIDDYDEGIFFVVVMLVMNPELFHNASYVILTPILCFHIVC